MSPFSGGPSKWISSENGDRIRFPKRLGVLNKTRTTDDVQERHNSTKFT
jgi:hypothetical protein